MKTARARCDGVGAAAVCCRTARRPTRRRGRRRGRPRCTRTSPASPIRCWRSWAAASAAWALGRPRRVADRSITSSWSRANVWSSSTAAAGSEHGLVVARRRWRGGPSSTKAGRSRLPPAATSDRISPVISPSTGSSADRLAPSCRRGTGRAVVPSGPWTTARAPSPSVDAGHHRSGRRGVPTRPVEERLPPARRRARRATRRVDDRARRAGRPARRTTGSATRARASPRCDQIRPRQPQRGRPPRRAPGVGAPFTSAMTTGHSSCSTVPSGISAR